MNQIKHQIKEKVSTQIWRQTRNQIELSSWFLIEDQIRNPIMNQVWIQIKNNINDLASS